MVFYGLAPHSFTSAVVCHGRPLVKSTVCICFALDFCLHSAALCKKWKRRRIKAVSDVLEKTHQAIVFILNEAVIPRLISLFSHIAAPSLISELRAEKIEQKSITLVWREPSYPNSSRTEYEVKYYEKVKSCVTSSCEL